MKNTRSRMLLVLIAAAVVVTFFIHWEDFSAGVLDGFDPVRSAASRAR